MRLRIAWLVSIMMISGSLAAQDRSSGLIHLKEAIDSNYFDATGYRFSRIILEAAHAADEKDKEVIRRKIGLMWQEYLFKPICADSSLRLVNVLPYAFSKPYQRLMLIVASGWEIDLNYFDNDQRTVLDHLDEAIAAAPNEARSNMLKEYREIYTNAGAKRRADLSFYIKNLSSRFDAVRPYAYGLFPVMKKGKWGWVNEKGITVIPLQYKAIRYFVKDVFEVSDDGINFYFVDRKNQRIRI